MKNFIVSIYGMFLKHLPVDDSLIVWESSGDFSDNAYALFDFWNSVEKLEGYKHVWLVDNPKVSMRNVKCIAKKGKISAIERLYYLSKCKCYIYDHTNFFNNIALHKKNGQIIVNLWHGAGFKAEKHANSKSNIDFMVTSSDFFKDEQSKVFGVDTSQVLTTGFPRTDYFYRKLNEIQIRQKELFAQYRKVIIWMPTFRRSSFKNLDEPYFNSYTGLPVLTQECELEEFDHYLGNNKLLCVFKVHHLQADLPAFKKNFANIVILQDDDIKKMGLQLYQYIMLPDCLITDYSSVSTDYLLLNKPIIYTIDDYEEYNESRGFNVENCIQYFAGDKVKNKDELYCAINNVLTDNDEYYDERNIVRQLFNRYSDGNHSERILNEIGIL